MLENIIDNYKKGSGMKNIGGKDIATLVIVFTILLIPLALVTLALKYEETINSLIDENDIFDPS